MPTLPGRQSQGRTLLDESSRHVEGRRRRRRPRSGAAPRVSPGHLCAAAEGLVGVASAKGRAAIVEVNAETDFVARNPTFQAFVAEVANIALGIGEDVEAIKAAPYPGTGSAMNFR